MDDARFARDRLEIIDLIHRYAHYLDAGRLDDFCGLFSQDAEIDVGAGESDRAAMAQLISTVMAERSRLETKHIIGNIIVEEQTERMVRGAANFLYTEMAGDLLSPVLTGNYTFTLIRTDEGWRISRWRAKSDRSRAN